MNPSTVLSPEIVDLGLAIGLLQKTDSSVQFDSGWFGDPGPRVAKALADEGRRAALIRFVDAVNGDAPVVNAGGVKLLKVFDANEIGLSQPLNLSVMLAIDDRATGYVEIGVAISYATDSPVTHTDVVVPLYRTGKLSGNTVLPVAEHFALAAGSPIRLATSLTLGGPPDSSGFGLGGIDLAATAPVDGSAPTVEITLTDLLLPGATAPTTIHIGGPGTTIEDSLLSLVLGVVHAGAAALGNAGRQALAALDLIGLGPSTALPPIDVADIATHGVAALRDWFTTTLADATARDAWLGAVRELIGGDPVADGLLRIPLAGGVFLTISLATLPGAGGHLKVTPRIGLELSTTIGSGPTAVDLTGRAAVDVVTVDLADGSLSALPVAELFVEATGHGARLVASGPVQIGTVHLGVGVDHGAVVPVVRLLDVQSGTGPPHPVVDLSSADAVVAAAGQVAGDLVRTALAALPAHVHLEPLLGLAATGASGMLDSARLLVDPLGTLGGWWHELLTTHAADVPDVLAHLRDLVAHDSKLATNGQPAAPISGDGTRGNPWSVPIVDRVSLDAWMDGDKLTVAVHVGFRVDDLAGGCTVVETAAVAELLRVDFAAGHASLLPAAHLSVDLHGRGQPNARLALGPVSVVATSIGLLADWTAVDGFRVGLAAPGLAAELDGTTVPLAFPTGGDWRAAALDDIERLVAVLGAAQPSGWLHDVVDLLGWTLVDDHHPHRLPLAAVAVDPSAALRAWADAVIHDADIVARATTAIAKVLTGAGRGLAGAISGMGRVDDPWVLDLGVGAAGPALSVALAPDGPRRAATTAASALQSWVPGLPGLPAGGLGEALRSDAGGGPDSSALARGRDRIGEGFAALLSRAADTDGLVIAPPSPIPGVEVVVDPTVTGDRWTTLTVERALGAAAASTAAVVHVMVASGSGDPWGTAPAARVLDLRAPGLTPEAFTVASPAAGEWFVALARRADATLGVSDPSGVLGQAARLQRVLAALGTGRPVVVIASSGAGHAARLAADATPAVTDLVTLGTPWSPVAFDTLRTGVAGDAVRALRALLPAVDLAEPDDADLALGRSLVTVWLDRDAQFELDAPRPTVTVRAGLNVRAWFGALDVAQVQRALTAIVAAGLSTRAQARDPLASAPATSAQLALRLPVPTQAEPSGHGVQVGGYVELGLAATAFGGSSTPVAPRVRVHLTIADADGWLVGGPGTTPPPGAPPLEVRFVEATVDVGLGSSTHDVQLVFHELSALGGYRDRVVVRPGAVTGTIEDLPFLPEARAVLNAVVQRLRATDAASLAAHVLAALDGFGLSTAGGLVPDALTHLLHDPAAFATGVLTSADGRSAVAAALAALVPGATRTGEVVTVTSGPATVVLDLATRRATFAASSTAGIVPWQANLTDIGAAHPHVSLTLGSAEFNALAVRLAVAPGAMVPFTADVLTQSATGTPSSIALWPTPDADGLVGLLSAALPAEATRLVLEGVRFLDAFVGTAIELVAGALGVLGPADGAGLRPIVAPLGLFRDPGGWLRNHVLGDGATLHADRFVDLFESLKPFVGLGGTPRGSWPLVPGISLLAEAAGDGARIGCALDPTVWLAGNGRLPFGAGITVGLLVGPGGAPHPTVTVFAGAPEEPPATHRRAIHVTLDGTNLAILLRPAVGSDIAIYPSAAGLGALMTSGTVELLLPMALNALAAMGGDATRQQVAALVTAFGKGLAVVDDPTVSPVTFSGTKLHDLTDNLTTRLGQRATALVAEAVGALHPLLVQLPGTGVDAAMVGNNLVVTVHGVTLTVQPSPVVISVDANVGGLPVVGNVTASFSAGADGVHGWGFGVGPAAFDLGGPVVRPLLRGSRSGPTWEVQLGLALDDKGVGDAGHKELFARWGGSVLDVVARTRTGTTNDDVVDDPGHIALFAADAVLELLGNYVIALADVSTLLDKTVNTGPPITVRSILQGSLLSATNDHAIAAQPVSNVPGNLFTLARKVAGALPMVTIGPVKVGLHLAGDLVGLRATVADQNAGIVLNPGGSVLVSLVTDSAWIVPPTGPSPDPGIIVDLVSISTADPPHVEMHPVLAANGVGVRIAKDSGPLLDAGLRIESVAVHLFGRVEPGSQPSTVAVSGGMQVELGGLAVPLGAGGGENAVAKGVVADAGGSGGPPTPKFSPALAIQSHHGGPGVQVSLRAGSGDGPWYLPIQRAFGPLYLEQVGLGTGYAPSPRTLESISVTLDGSVSLFGISASVDKLRFTYHVAKNFFDAHSWEVDLDGLAISSSIGGLTLAGALLKTPLTGGQTGVDYLGMLKIGFNGYGVDLFGGYSHPDDGSGSYASFFAFGALHAPLGGPPAFFITGIGVGFGINRELKPPTMETITSNPFLVAMKALGPAPEPKQQLLQMQQNIAPKRGEYWVAAGISFTSFVLISGEIVVTVAFGDGLEITLLGLARAELPAPVLKLVSIELALLARFSTKEGSLLVQAQLTENSWLLTESVRLTGGFGFATWWKGPNAGQVVVTMGGYHPKFHHDGYPVVPRLGFRWQPIDAVSIIGESYFALCSEALMAGTRFEANAHFGPAYARMSFGADGIVYFDPFWFEISAYAEVAAGIKLWLLFGTVTIELSLGATITVNGPPVRVSGRFEICGFDVPFEFGDTADPTDKALSNVEFRDKYLRAASDAQVLQAAVVRGALPAGRKSDGAADKVPDGSIDHPFLVVPEFEIVFITTAPAIDMSLDHVRGANTESSPMHRAAPGVGVAPMLSHTLASHFHVELIKLVPEDFTIGAITVTPRSNASFPKGVWGEAPDKNAKQVPAGETVDAADGFTMSTVLGDLTGAPAVDYHQVEIRRDRKRKPLPFVTNTANTNARLASAAALKALTGSVRPDDDDVAGRFGAAAKVMQAGGYGAVGTAALRGERAAVPAFGSLADDLVLAPAAVSRTVDLVQVDHTPAPPAQVGPKLLSLLSMPTTAALRRPSLTTVKDPGAAVLRDVPSTAAVRSETTELAPASLVLHEPRAVVGALRTTMAVGSAPLTRLATSPIAAVANGRPGTGAFERLQAISDELPQGTTLRDGDVAVVSVGSRPPGEITHAVSADGACRVVGVAAGGNVLVDELLQPVPGQGAVQLSLPDKTERVVLVAPGELAALGSTLDGWYRGQSLPLIGWDLALAAGAIVRFESHKAPDNSQRSNGGWANTRELVRAASVVTRFDRPVRAIAIAVDDVGGADAAAAVEMRLVGAVRSAGPTGLPAEPVVLVQGVRSVLVFAVDPTPDPAAFDPNVTVVVDNCRQGQLAGVAATVQTRDELVELLSRSGFDSSIAPPLAGGTGARTVRWIAAPTPGGPDAPTPAATEPPKPRRRPAKKAPAKKAPAKKKTAPGKKAAATRRARPGGR